jgi:hypothetical protein
MVIGRTGSYVPLVLTRWLTRAVAVVAPIAATATVATKWGFYPVGLIVLLVAALVGALWVAWERGRQPQNAHGGERAHDAWVVREVRDVLSRNDLEVIRSWDFGGSWRREWIEPIMRVAELDDVEHRPLDHELATEFRRLLDAAHEFLNYHTLNTFPERTGGERGWRNVGWSGGEAEGLDPERRRVWNERARRIEALADDLAAAYDSFIDLARRNVLLVTE